MAPASAAIRHANPASKLVHALVTMAYVLAKMAHALALCQNVLCLS